MEHETKLKITKYVIIGSLFIAFFLQAGYHLLTQAGYNLSMLNPRLLVVSLALIGAIFFYLLVGYLKNNERFAWYSFQTMLTGKHFLLLGSAWIIFTVMFLYYLIMNYA